MYISSLRVIVRFTNTPSVRTPLDSIQSPSKNNRDAVFKYSRLKPSSLKSLWDMTRKRNKRKLFEQRISVDV